MVGWMGGRKLRTSAAAALVLALPLRAVALWECTYGTVTSELLVPDSGTSIGGGLMSCPAYSDSFRQFENGSVGTGDLSFQSDGDSATFHLRIELNDMPDQRVYMLMAVGYFRVDFDGPAQLSIDEFAESLEGDRGSIYVVPGCADPGVTAFRDGSGTDFVFGPDGGSCDIWVETSVSRFEAGVSEYVFTAMASIVPEPGSAALLAAGLLGLAAVRRRTRAAGARGPRGEPGPSSPDARPAANRAAIS